MIEVIKHIRKGECCDARASTAAASLTDSLYCKYLFPTPDLGNI